MLSRSTMTELVLYDSAVEKTMGEPHSDQIWGVK